MQKALQKQQKQENKYQKKKLLYSTLFKLVKSNPQETYEFYRSALQTFEIEASSKRTLQRDIQKCKENISKNEDSSPSKILQDRKQILTRDQISQVKSYLEEHNMLNLQKKELTNFINQYFISDTKKQISQTSKFIYLNFNGYYLKQSQQQKKHPQQHEREFQYQEEDSFNPFDASFEQINPEKNGNQQNQQILNSLIPLFPLEDNQLSCPIDIYEQQNDQNNAENTDYIEQNWFAQQFKESGFNFYQITENFLQDQNNFDKQDTSEFFCSDFNFSNSN